MGQHFQLLQPVDILMEVNMDSKPTPQEVSLTKIGSKTWEFHSMMMGKRAPLVGSYNINCLTTSWAQPTIEDSKFKSGLPQKVWHFFLSLQSFERIIVFEELTLIEI